MFLLPSFLPVLPHLPFCKDLYPLFLSVIRKQRFIKDNNIT